MYKMKPIMMMMKTDYKLVLINTNFQPKKNNNYVKNSNPELTDHSYILCFCRHNMFKRSLVDISCKEKKS